MVLSHPELYAQLNVLKRIHSVARQTAQNLISYRTAQIPPSSSTPQAPPLAFTPLDTILEPLSKLDVSEDIRADLKKAFSERVSALQEKCIVNYRDACNGAPWVLESPASVEKLRQSYQKFAHRQAMYLVESQVPYLQEEIAKYQQHYSSVDTKLSFNHEYTPILEKYFEHNAYPSLPDRHLLAQKSNMNPRQIEVWFQNHRNRARKAAKTDSNVVLKRLSAQEASQIDLEEMMKTVSPFVVSRRSRSATAEASSSRDTTPDVPTQIAAPLIIPTRPPHAFPTRFSETGLSDPFPKENGVFKFAYPEWQRRPATQPVAHTTLGMDELCLNFQTTLTLRGPSSAKRAAKLKKNAEIEKWYAATITPKTDAPHPASIRSQYACMPSSVPTQRSPHTWQAPTAITRRTYRRPSHLPSWKMSTSRTSPRKEPPLPRRIPSSLPTRTPNSAPYRTPSLESLAFSDSGSSTSTLAESESRSTSYSDSTLFEPELNSSSKSHTLGSDPCSSSFFAPSSSADVALSAESFFDLNNTPGLGANLDCNVGMQSTDPLLGHGLQSDGFSSSMFGLDSIFSIPTFELSDINF